MARLTNNVVYAYIWRNNVYFSLLPSGVWNSKTLALTERFRQGVIKTGVGTKKVFKRLCYSVYKALPIPVYDYTTLG